MKTTITALLAGGLALSLAVAAWAQPGSGPRGGFGGGIGAGIPNPELMLEHMADHLDLDEAQRDSIQAIMESVRPEAKALREQARSNRQALHDADRSSPDYENVVNEVAVSNGNLATQATLLFAQVSGEVRDILTEEQLEKLERARERMQSRGKRRFQRG